MRLSTDQLSAIRQIAAQAFGDQVAVWLFGSRVDDGMAAAGLVTDERGRLRLEWLRRLG